jgi:hypothetical protein
LQSDFLFVCIRYRKYKQFPVSPNYFILLSVRFVPGLWVNANWARQRGCLSCQYLLFLTVSTRNFAVVVFSFSSLVSSYDSVASSETERSNFCCKVVCLLPGFFFLVWLLLHLLCFLLETMPTLHHRLRMFSCLAGCVVCHLCEGSVYYGSRFADLTAEDKSELVDVNQVYLKTYASSASNIGLFVAQKRLRLGCVLIWLPSLHSPTLLSSLLFEI